MADLPEALRDVCALLKTAGITANIDPARISPPGAWVHADTFTIEHLDGGGQLACYIDLVVPARSVPIALQELTAMLTKALTVVTPDGAVELDRGVELSNNKMLPAFRIPLTIDI